MRPFKLWSVYLAVVFLGGALLAPWLWHGVQWLSGHLPVLEPVAHKPFHRYVSRSMLLLALFGLVPLFRRLGGASLSGFGLQRLPGGAKRVAIGFCLGFAILGVVAALDVAIGTHHWGLGCPKSELGLRLLKALLTAAAVSFIEELLFRGALMGSLMRDGRVRTALLASSLLYAWVHFFARVQWQGAIEWNTGLKVLAGMCSGLVEADRLMPSFLNLVLAGTLLGYCYQMRGTLHLPIGLHAGWVFWLKAHGLVSVPAAALATVDGRAPRLDEGWAACLVLTVALGAFLWWSRRQNPSALKPDALPQPAHLEKLA